MLFTIVYDDTWPFLCFSNGELSTRCLLPPTDLFISQKKCDFFLSSLSLASSLQHFLVRDVLLVSLFQLTFSTLVLEDAVPGPEIVVTATFPEDNPFSRMSWG